MTTKQAYAGYNKDRGFMFRPAVPLARGTLCPPFPLDGNGITTKAVCSSTPGLVIHETIGLLGGLFVVTHLMSGKKVATAETYRAARGIAGALGGLPVNWLQPEDRVLEAVSNFSAPEIHVRLALCRTGGA